MPKRPMDATPGDDGNGQPHRKHQRHNHDQRHRQHPHQGHPSTQQHANHQSTTPTPAAALQLLPPATTTLGPIPGLRAPILLPPSSPIVDPSLPPLPPIPEGPLRSAPFRHKSTATYDRSLATATTNPQADPTYERLEFLGDAYIELMASRLIFARFAHLPAGAMSQLREQLVKNETLCGYGRAYGFDQRVDVADFARMRADARDRGNKGLNKIVGDVFEAYVAAVVLADPTGGFAVAETWLTALWAPKLAEVVAADRLYLPLLAGGGDLGKGEGEGGGDGAVGRGYDSTAKSTLQRRILRDATVKLAYEPYKDSVELKGAQLGQNRHFIAVYLSGYGYERKLLGRGEGKNKVEAGNWAATEAMHGLGKEVVDECERQALAAKEAKAVAKAAAAAALAEQQQKSDAPGPGDADADE